MRFGKPAQNIFEECVTLLAERGVSDRSRICMVGDSLDHDIAGAATAGLAAVFITVRLALLSCMKLLVILLLNTPCVCVRVCVCE